MAAELIHDVAYEHYGRRVATCSSDHVIRIFDANGNKTAEWRAHAGTIWRLSWAHPEFGVALASCSFDRKVCIWEENADAEEAALDAAMAPAATAKTHSAWFKAAELADARDSIVDVQFAPPHMGVRLASCSADGLVRIHEAPDVLDLSSWERHSELDAIAAAAESAAEAAANAAASGGGGGGASDGGGGVGGSVGAALGDAGVGGGAGLGAGGTLCCSGGGDRGRDSSASGAASTALADGGAGAGGAAVGPLCLAWGTSSVEPPMLVVGMGDGTVLLWVYREKRDGWARSLAFERQPLGGRCHVDCVRSVSWAADMGRSYQLLATGSRDRTVKLWALQRSDGAADAAAEPDGGEGSWVARCCAELPHRLQVWRVSWNASGSMLATSEDDGTVRVFKMDGSGGWQQAQPTALD